MKKTVFSLLVFSLVFSFTACGGSGSSEKPSKKSEEPKKIDLAGDWKQSNSGSDESYQVATIQNDVIEIFWYSEEDETKALYWSGTYAAPEDAKEPYSWVSDNDREKTDGALMASGDDTKTFTYEKGQLSYEVSALGVTQTVRLEKAK